MRSVCDFHRMQCKPRVITIASVIVKKFITQKCNKILRNSSFLHCIDFHKRLFLRNKTNLSDNFQFNLIKFEKNWRHKIGAHTVNLNKANRKERLCQWHVIISPMLQCDGAAYSFNIVSLSVYVCTPLTFRCTHTSTSIHTAHSICFTFSPVAEQLNAFNVFSYMSSFAFPFKYRISNFRTMHFDLAATINYLILFFSSSELMSKWKFKYHAHLFVFSFSALFVCRKECFCVHTWNAIIWKNGTSETSHI